MWIRPLGAGWSDPRRATVAYTQSVDDWKDNLVTDDVGVSQILRECRRIAVLGIKPESRAGAPAFYVPEYMLRQGYDVVPVPVYYPEVVEILGRRVYRSLRDVPGPIDMVNVFRRPRDIPPHVADILAVKPRVGLAPARNRAHGGGRVPRASGNPGRPGPLPDGGAPAARVTAPSGLAARLAPDRPAGCRRPAGPAGRSLGRRARGRRLPPPLRLNLLPGARRAVARPRGRVPGARRAPGGGRPRGCRLRPRVPRRVRDHLPAARRRGAPGLPRRRSPARLPCSTCSVRTTSRRDSGLARPATASAGRGRIRSSWAAASSSGRGTSTATRT